MTKPQPKTATADDPTPEQVAATAKRLIAAAVQPIAGNAELREKLIDVRRSYEQVIDTATKDTVISGEFSREAADRAREQTQSFRQFIEDNKDEITALQVLYSQPYGRRAHLRRHQGTGPGHRPPTPSLDARSAMEGLRDPRRLQGQRIRPPRQHRPGQPRPPRPRPNGRVGRVPRPSRRALRSLATTSSRQLGRNFTEEQTRLPPPDQGAHRRQPRRGPGRPSEPTLQHPRRPRQGPPALRQRPQPLLEELTLVLAA